MAKKDRFTTDQVIEALQANAGINTYAAAWLEKKTGLRCVESTIRGYRKRYKKVQKAAEEIEFNLLDVAEHQLFKLIRDGHASSVHFYLKTKGKERGYTERVESTGKDGEPIETLAVIRVPHKCESNEEWQQQYGQDQE